VAVIGGPSALARFPGGALFSREASMESDGRVGRHLMAFEEPDVFFMRFDGPVSAEEGSIVNHWHLEVSRGRDQVFFLIDLAHLEGIGPEVRKEASLVMRELPLRGIAGYRAPLKARVMAKLIVTAMNIFKAGANRAPLVFLDTEEQARAWIASRRREGLHAA